MIRVFKMISGEELISKVSDTGTGWELDSPAVIMIQQTEKGVGVGLMPYMPYASGKVTLHRTAVASDGIPDVKMENEYNRIFGSGIQIASTF
jgi:hypothetical protein